MKNTILSFLLILTVTFPALAQDRKISQLTDGGAVQTTDNIPAVRSGANVRVQFGSAAAGDIGSDVQAYDATLAGIAGLSGLTDNCALRADSTVGMYQCSGVVLDDSNNATGFDTLDATGKITVTSTTEQLRLAYDVSNYLTFTIASNGVPTINSTASTIIFSDTILTPGNIRPSSDGGASLGTATISYQNLYLDTGGTINFNNGDVVLTHSSNTLTLSGGDLALGANNLTMTGSIGATGSRVTKVWTAALESTAAPTVGGSAVYYAGGTDVPVTDGGTGSSTAAGARTNLGLRANEYCWAASDYNTTLITAATGLATEYLPAAFTVTGVRAYTRTAPTGTMTIDINEAGTTLMASTKLTIDANEKSSGTAATAAVVSDTAIAANAEITVDVDSTTGGKGLVVCMEGTF